MSVKLTLLGVLFLFTSLAAAEPAPGLPPIAEVKGVEAKPNVFEAASNKKPLVIRSTEDAGKYFGEAALARLKKQVDFDKQVVLVFAWKGSGQDKLGYAVAESFPEQVMFDFTPGRTRDLRSHVKVYALRSNVKWKAPQ